MNIEFIYSTTESKYSKLECYEIYDFEENELVKDVKLNKIMIALDRNNKLIYFCGMECGTHWILEKNYFYKIIQEFMKKMKDYDCEDYTIYQDCTGGQIYYKYK